MILRLEGKAGIALHDTAFLWQTHGHMEGIVV
jgi:hypothetical protein